MHYTTNERITVGVIYGDLMCSSPGYYEMSSVTRRLHSWSGLIHPIVIRVSKVYRIRSYQVQLLPR
jgi:hypothetical protein